ncbi:DUF3122 domain-containing protein [Kamptonema animale CS-326]|jgi:hypothetical protein|uniref:DUF3122 domain-containing protein n=1 Tax=Kamptonema animale TaxID=92934 RepID=UPI0023311771|nr:DUF3122 domain-containing protein [Kamptonema animale]MDB9509766.1 DUF3122 domain-containing protein [Kamptonema animale CS-326]
MKKRLRALGLTIVSILLLLIAVTITIEPAMALVQKIEEAPGQILYQARHHLRDSSGNSWQVILFKQSKTNQADSINLRLVAFPDVAEFAHPKDLQIATTNGQNFTAADVFERKAPAPNVGQYDLSPFLNKLPEGYALKLSLPLVDGQSLILNIPPSWVEEWQQVAQAA